MPPPVRTVHRGGSRFYVHPTDRNVAHPGVTSILGMGPKPFLPRWSAKMTAELAVDSLPFVAEMAERDRQGAIDYLKGAAFRYTKNRANLGSEAHDLFEREIRGERVGHVRDDLTPYLRHFREFLECVNPEIVRAEEIAWSDTHEYAGSFDVLMIVWVDSLGRITPDRSGTPRLVMGDWKTSRDTYPEVAMQLAAYANADFVITADGIREPMPLVDGGAVLHVTDKSWAFKPVDIGPDVFAHFLHLRATFDWDRHVSRNVIGKPLVSGGAIETGTQRRG